MSFDRKCDQCRRDHYMHNGDIVALEVCWSQKHGQFRCKRCHFEPSQEEIRIAALVTGPA